MYIYNATRKKKFSSGKAIVTTQYIQISIKINPGSRTGITVNLDRKNHS